MLVTVFIVAFLFSALIGVQLVNLVRANFFPPQPNLPSMYIKSDGSVDPPAPIQRVGAVYTFTGNIANYTIEIQRDNIVIDGAGYTLQGNGSGTGIELTNRNNITIKNLAIKQFRTGINFNNSSTIIISGNSITSTTVAIAIGFSSCNNRIERNHIVFNFNAILLYDSCQYNNIIGNNITENGDSGIWCEGTKSNSNYTSIIGNNIKGNGRFGILIRASSSNKIIGNNISNHTDTGIMLSGSTSQEYQIIGNNITNNKNGIYISGGSENNKIIENNIAHNEVGIETYKSSNIFCQNNFVNNTDHAISTQSANVWNDGEEGNYWSDYTGTDNNGDGVGDTAYVIDANNQDAHPLMKPIEISEPEIPNTIPEFPTWTPMLLALAVFTVAVTIYKRRLRKLRNKKRMSCKHELLERK